MQAWIIGNWKQNPATVKDVNTLLDSVLAASEKKDTDHQSCQLMVAPSCVHLAAVSTRLQNSSILVSAQDVSAHSSSTGAYTGDCSAQQVADAGASWTLLGHSERRQYHHESNDSLLAKLNCAFTQGLGVVLCIGETQEEYDAKQTINVLDEQLMVLKNLLQTGAVQQQDFAERLIIAYEPVWAIGTGKVPTVSEVSATHQHIKQKIASFAPELPEISVLYGGSVNADNADSFAASPMINGALVGGASLKADSFLAINDAFSRAKG